MFTYVCVYIYTYTGLEIVDLWAGRRETWYHMRTKTTTEAQKLLLKLLLKHPKIEGTGYFVLFSLFLEGTVWASRIQSLQSHVRDLRLSRLHEFE